MRVQRLTGIAGNLGLPFRNRNAPAHLCVRLWKPHRSDATLLKGTGEDVKTVQELIRHANNRLTLDVYAQALTPAKHAAHLKVVEMIRPIVEREVVPMCSHAQQVSFDK